MHLNNKGFAISAILYSLFILIITLMFLVLGILANRRITLNKINDTAQEEINNRKEPKYICSIDYTNTMLYNYNKNTGRFGVELAKGNYLIQAWGASGDDSSAKSGGNGAYVSVIYEVAEDTSTIYLSIGKEGTDSSGGGATTVSTADKLLYKKKNQSQLEDSEIIMVAAGGGAAASGCGGGHAGDLDEGYAGRPFLDEHESIAKYRSCEGEGAKSTRGGKGGGRDVSCSDGSDGDNGSKGKGGSGSGNGGDGGDGYYGGGGGANSSEGGGGGGVSYINPTMKTYTTSFIDSNSSLKESLQNMCKLRYKDHDEEGNCYKYIIGVGLDGSKNNDTWMASIKYWMPKIGDSTTKSSEILTSKRQTGNNGNGAVRITPIVCEWTTDY